VSYTLQQEEAQEMSFRACALHAYGRNNKICNDFLKDLERDEGFPRDADTWPTIEAYLLDNDACEKAVWAAQRIWKSYDRRGMKRHGYR
jgi:hypothetical protein